jgi:hypothetical protein
MDAIENRRKLEENSALELAKFSANERLNIPEDGTGAVGVTRSVSSSCLLCGERIPKNRVTFVAQIIAIFGIIILSAVNLCLNSGSNKELWIALLSSAVGYVLPSPGLKYTKRKQQQQQPDTWSLLKLQNDEQQQQQQQ